MDHIVGEILPYLPDRAIGTISSLSDAELLDLREIRIKADQPLLLCSGAGRRICSDSVHTKAEIDTAFRKICASSSYTHRNEIRAGFVTIPGGHRVGIVGTAVLGEGGRVEGMREICGLCFRIAREYSVALDPILPHMCHGDRIRNLLILGPPCSGKTTVLRAISKALSQRVPVSVIDEREELFPSSRPVPVGCDVLRGYPKAAGIMQALRTLSPRVIVCDELGTAAEVSAMMDGLSSGVSLVATAHAYSSEEWLRRPPVRELFFAGGIDVVAFLDPARAGRVCEIREREDLCVEMRHADSGVSSVCGMRDRLFS